MSDLILDRMAELHRINGDEEGTSAAPAAPVDATPAGTAPAAPVAAAPNAARVLSLDDLLPDHPDLPPTFRGKPFRELAEDRRQAIKRRDDDAQIKNNFESENVVLKSLISAMIERQPGGPAAATPTPVAAVAPASAEDRIRGENLDAIMTADPALALGRAIEIARETITPEINGQLEPLAQKVAALEATERARTLNTAYDQAGRMLGRDMAVWRDPNEVNTIAWVVESMRWPQDNPESYVRAAQHLDTLVAARAPRAAAPLVTPAPTAPAPPVGGGAPAGPSEGAPAALSTRDASTVSRVAKAYGLKPEQVEQVYHRVMGVRKAAGAR